jgi:hypothetical protein
MIFDVPANMHGLKHNEKNKRNNQTYKQWFANVCEWYMCFHIFYSFTAYQSSGDGLYVFKENVQRGSFVEIEILSMGKSGSLGNINIIIVYIYTLLVKSVCWHLKSNFNIARINQR